MRTCAENAQSHESQGRALYFSFEHRLDPGKHPVPGVALVASALVLYLSQRIYGLLSVPRSVRSGPPHVARLGRRSPLVWLCATSRVRHIAVSDYSARSGSSGHMEENRKEIDNYG